MGILVLERGRAFGSGLGRVGAFGSGKGWGFWFSGEVGVLVLDWGEVGFLDLNWGDLAVLGWREVGVLLLWGRRGSGSRGTWGFCYSWEGVVVGVREVYGCWSEWEQGCWVTCCFRGEGGRWWVLPLR